MNADGSLRGRQAVALVAAVGGGFLLYYRGRRESDHGLAFAALLAGVLLFIATLAYLSSDHAMGTYEATGEEFRSREWRWHHFLRFGYAAAPLLLPIRLYVGYEWLNSGWVYYQQAPWLATAALVSAVAALALAAYRAQRRIEDQAGSASTSASREAARS